MEKYTEALKIKRSKNGSDHQSVTDTLCNMASLFLECGMLEEALCNLEEALPIMQSE
jgi:hypothetical protein